MSFNDVWYINAESNSRKAAYCRRSGIGESVAYVLFINGIANVHTFQLPILSIPMTPLSKRRGSI